MTEKAMPISRTKTILGLLTTTDVRLLANRSPTRNPATSRRVSPRRTPKEHRNRKAKKPNRQKLITLNPTESASTSPRSNDREKSKDVKRKPGRKNRMEIPTYTRIGSKLFSGIK